MTVDDLAQAIMYLKNEDGIAAKDAFVGTDAAISILIQAAENFLDIALDQDSVVVPLVASHRMIDAGIVAMNDPRVAHNDFIKMHVIYNTMVLKVPRDARMPSDTPGPAPTI
ncbi:hypothetical protein J0X19_11875 [Hymenobacter sp. BT186]|uniref:Uncharacterized protein n=1 Tax=Hymenobacter telluris TaxID=2816474 RepID=A0A939JB04_9BACT|nr:hypothetical protein [Hymenobacter telluris]MBO0358646.1 hypothetical protein [Hymenobacter telluris]MBW3374672.1 hypothetical protein [Hymenobacter norwichensis]